MPHEGIFSVYSSLVRSQFFWPINLVDDVQGLGRVRRTATRMLLGLCQLLYEDRILLGEVSSKG